MIALLDLAIVVKICRDETNILNNGLFSHRTKTEYSQTAITRVGFVTATMYSVDFTSIVHFPRHIHATISHFHPQVPKL